MRTVYKYPVGFGGRKHEVPKASKVVLFGPDKTNVLCVWLEVVTTAPTETRLFDVIGTGDQAFDNLHHCMSCVDGPYIWHLYSDKP